MNKFVYIVTDGEYSDYAIKAVFSKKKQAEIYAALHDFRFVERWPIDSSVLDAGREPSAWWTGEFCLKPYTLEPLLRIRERRLTFENVNRIHEYFDRIIIDVTADRRVHGKKIEKIMRDRVYKYLSEKEER